jgi:hypothetical protein
LYAHVVGVALLKNSVTAAAARGSDTAALPGLKSATVRIPTTMELFSMRVSFELGISLRAATPMEGNKYKAIAEAGP